VTRCNRAPTGLNLVPEFAGGYRALQIIWLFGSGEQFVPPTSGLFDVHWIRPVGNELLPAGLDVVRIAAVLGAFIRFRIKEFRLQFEGFSRARSGKFSDKPGSFAASLRHRRSRQDGSVALSCADAGV
jgi:hypothetical protein